MKVIIELYNKKHQFIQSLGFNLMNPAMNMGKYWEKTQKGNYFVIIM